MSNLFLRHGEVNNIKNIMYSDIPGYRLSSKGISQAKEAGKFIKDNFEIDKICLLYTSPSPRDYPGSRMPSSA